MKLNNETKVGLLASIAVTLLVLGYNFLQADKLFQDSFRLVSIYENVATLNIGNKVIYNGLTVGQVKSLTMDNETGRTAVTFVIDKGLMIPIDSRAIIYSLDLLGTKAVKIERGESYVYCKSGQYIDGDHEEELSEMVKREMIPLTTDIKNVLVEMERFMGWLNNTMDETNGNRIDNILEDFTITSKNIKGVSTKIDTLVTNVKSTIYKTNTFLNKMNSQSESIEKIMKNAETFTDSLVASTDGIKAMVSNASSAISDIERLIERIENGEGTIGKLVTDTTFYDEAKRTLSQLDNTLKEFSDDPRLNLYVKLWKKRTTKQAERERAERDFEKEEKKKKKKKKGKEGGKKD